MALRSALLFSSASLGGQVLSLLRTLLLARLLSLEDMGIAATYLIILTLIEMLSQIGLERLLVQARDGEDPRLQAGLQMAQVLRGLIGAVMVLGIAWPIAFLFDQVEIAPTYMILAIAPLLGGFLHFDQFRFKREMQFGPASLMLVAPQAISLVMLLLASLFIIDHRIMLLIIISQQLSAVALSHWLAQRRYELHWDAAMMRRIIGFGLPLFFNGILLFVVMNGERMLVGNQLGMEQLAIFTLMLNLAMTPTLVLTESAVNWFLPQLSRLGDEAERFEALSHAAFEAHIFMGLAIAVGAALIGPPVVALLLGEKFLPGLGLFVWLAMGQALRIAKGGPGVVALSKGYPGNQLLANVLRVLMLPLGWLWLLRGGDLLGLAWLAIAGEMAGFVVALIQSARKTGISVAPTLLPALLGALTLALIGADLLAREASPSLAEWLHPFQLVYLASAVLAVLSMRALRGLVLGGNQTAKG